MPNWRKLIVSGSDASLNSLNVTTNVTAQSFTGSFSGSFTAPGATTQIVYNSGGTLAADSGLVYSGSRVGIGTTSPAAKLDVNGNAFIGTTLSVGTTYNGFTANIAGTTYIIGASVWVNDGYGYVNASSNTGMFPDSSHNITFKSNNSTKVYINAAGNVGIGTTSPGAKLQISGGTLDGSALTELGISSGLTTGRLGTFDASSLASISTRGDASSVELAAGSSATYYTGISATANNATLFTGTLRFFTSGSEKVRIDASGNVGIGTTSPNVTLEANGIIRSDRVGVASQYVQINGGDATGPFITAAGAAKVLTIQNNSTTSSDIYFDQAVASTYQFKQATVTKMILDASGNVGIGTTSPSSSLDVVVSSGGTSGLRFRGYSDAATPYLLSLGTYSYPDQFQIKSVNGLVTMGIVGSTGANPDLAFQTNTTERMRITTAGNVGIGTTSPTSKLDVIGNSYISGSLSVKTTSTAGTGLTVGGSTVLLSFAEMQQGNAFYFYSSGNTYNSTIRQDSQNLILTPDTNVGIGTASPSQKLEVQGQAQIGNDSVTSAGLFIARKNSNQAKSHYFLSAQESPTYQWIEGGYFTSELAGVSVANNSGKPYYESYSPAGQYKSFGFINQTTSGSSFTSTAATASMTLFQGGNIALAPTQGNVGIGTSSPSTKFVVSNAGASGFEVDPTGGVGSGVLLQAYNRSTSAYMAQSYYALTHTFNVGSGAGTRALDITSAGNVGIGTTSPGNKLHIAGAANGSDAGNIRIDSTDQYGGLVINENTTFRTFLGYGNANHIFSNAQSDSTALRAANYLHLGASSVATITINASDNVGIGTTSPGYKLEVVGAVSASTYYGDGSNLTNIGSGSISAAGSDGQLQYNNSGLFGGATRLIYNDTTNRVGIGTSSPGYDLDVSGSVRAQDRLRVGTINTGNGVIHQSSDATINASGATIVWSVPGSSGAVAFIEYYIINTVTNTSQRGGNIVVTWNSAGTPQITHTETTTPDIGTTALITFTTAITLGGDPQLIATNTSINPFYIVLNYRYF